MRVIEQGKSKEELEFSGKKKCTTCDCVFVYDKNDVKNDRDGNYVVCPNEACKKIINVGSIDR